MSVFYSLVCQPREIRNHILIIFVWPAYRTVSPYPCIFQQDREWDMGGLWWWWGWAGENWLKKKQPRWVGGTGAAPIMHLICNLFLSLESTSTSLGSPLLPWFVSRLTHKWSLVVACYLISMAQLLAVDVFVSPLVKPLRSTVEIFWQQCLSHLLQDWLIFWQVLAVILCRWYFFRLLLHVGFQGGEEPPQTSLPLG